MSRPWLLPALLIVAVATAATRSLAETSAVSVWDGVFTRAQATRGQLIYAEPCGKCHGYRLDGAPDDPDMFSTPPLAGAKFLREWNGRSLGALLQYSLATMPANNPGSVKTGELVDVLAYMLFASGVPPGDVELPADEQELARMEIVLQAGRN